MAEWQTVRFDPTYEEPLDPEIIPLLDAMNAAGFVTTASCCGHGVQWPYVVFENTDTARIERMARFVIDREQGDFRPHFTQFQREVLAEGHAWSLTVHLNNVYHDTPPNEALRDAITGMSQVASLITEWSLDQPPGERQ
jgi:hypothetical protein